MAVRWVRRLVLIGVLAALLGVVSRRRPSAVAVWPALAGPAEAAPPRAPVPVDPEPDPASWVAPAQGTCPAGFPVKAGASGIYHVPGGRSYDQTTPQRCYATSADAERDGYRAPKA